MASISLTITVKRAWWVIPYVSAVAGISRLTGIEPNIDKIVANAMRGVTLIVK